MGECADETLERLSNSIWFRIGKKSAEAYLAHEEWLFRRVEAIEFIDRHSVKRSISVDFELPCGLPSLKTRAPEGARLVPISVFHKWPPLMGFNLVGPDGHPTSRYTGTTNKQLDFGLLLGMADRALAVGEDRGERESWERRRRLARRRERPAPERLAPVLRRELAAVVHNPDPAQAAVAQAVNALRAELNTRLRDALARERMQDRTQLAANIAVTVDLAARLAGTSILWVVVEGAPGTDRIVKFSYLDVYGSGDSRLKALLIACSWQRRKLFISLPHAGRHVRYHLDIPAPEGCVELAVVEAMALPPAPGAEDVQEAAVLSVDSLAEKYPDFDLPDEWVGPQSSRYFLDYGKPNRLASTSETHDDAHVCGPGGTDQEAHAERVDRRTHIYLGARSAPSHRVFLQIELAASRQGFIRNCALAAALIAFVMVVAYCKLTSVVLHVEATVVLLAVVPVVLGYLLVRPGESGLERSHISGVRVMALISGATPILAALSIVLTHGPHASETPALASVRPLWAALALVSVLMAAGLFVSWFKAAPSKE